MRNIIIFGNGLGRALDPEFFTLEKAMSDVWDNSPCLSAEAKLLIRACLPSNIDKPSSEDHLQDIYDALSSCQILREFEESREDNNADFLSQEGKNFFGSVRTYVTLVASYFHGYDGNLSDDFIEPLVAYIKATKTHVATLNYDKLLYEGFIHNGIFGTYTHCHLADGMINSGFTKDNLNRHAGRTFGWYLHLHGSPLFRDIEGAIKKIAIADLVDEASFNACPLSNHVVLSHVNHKRLYIEQSDLLSGYWEYFDKALSEAEKIIVFGYSGGDRHLNDAIKTKSIAGNKPVIVIKRINPEQIENENELWVQRFGQNTTLRLEHNILDFVDWAAI